MKAKSILHASRLRLSNGQRTTIRGILLGAAAALIYFVPAAFAGDDSNPVVKVEEDWEVQVGAPDPNSDAPQIITVITPGSSLNSHYALFELNHTSQPKYSAGGMQLQLWHGDHTLFHHNFPNSNKLATANETITFTQQMSLSDGRLNFEVTNGNSTTWGKFGGQGYLKSFLSTTLSNLNGYSPETSVKHSRVGYASNRVNKFSLKAVRYYTADGQMTTDSTERIVHDHTSP